MKLSNNLVFTGCSIVAGTGWNEQNVELDFPSSEHLWVNKCHKDISRFKDLNLINRSYAGATNAELFADACYTIATIKPKVLVCCWTAIRRLKVNIGLELYDTEVTTFNFHKKNQNKKLGINMRMFTIGGLTKSLDKVRSMQHPHFEIATLLRYTNIIDSLCIQFGIRVYPVNAICPWDNGFFDKKEQVLPSEYTNYTQKLLSAGTRDDSEVFQLYNLIHQEYINAGGVSKNWINLYASLKSMQVDTTYDNTHPGLKSNDLYFNLVKEHIDNE